MSVKKSILYVAGCYTAWGLLVVFWKQLGQVDSIYTMCARVFYSFITCAIIILVGKKRDKLKEVWKNKAVRGRLFLAGLSVCFNWYLYIFSVANQKIIDCTLAFYMVPVITAFAGMLLFKEHLDGFDWTAVAFAFLGIFVPILMYGVFPFMAVFISLSFTVYSILKKPISVDPEICVFIEMLPLALPALAYMLRGEIMGTGGYSILPVWKWVLVPLAGVVTAIPLLFFTKGIRKTPLSLSGILMYLNPTLQLLITVTFFQEKFTKENLVTTIFVVLSVVVYVLGRIKKNSRIKAEAGN